MAPTWANMDQLGQLRANMDVAKPEKLAFRLDGNTIFTKLHVSPWDRLGSPWGTPWGTLGTPWGAIRGALGTPWEALGTPWGGHGGRQVGPSQERSTQGRAEAEMAAQHGHRRGESPRPHNEIILLIFLAAAKRPQKKCKKQTIRYVE